MSKKKKIIISVIAAVLIIAVIVSAVVIAMTKGKNAAKASGVYANKVADVMYQAGSTNKYSGVVEAADTMDIKADSEKKVKDILVSEGDEVQVGTPLFTYDTKDLAAKKESATLELESLNNTLSGYDAQIEQLTKEKKEAPKDQQLDYTLQIQQAQTQQKQTQYDIATKKAEIEKYDESIKNATVNSTMIGVVKKINENQSADTADTAFMTIVATAVYGIIAPVTGAQVGVLQPADHKGIPVFLRAGRQPVPDLRLHAGDEQVFAAPAHSAAVVGHQKGLLQHRSKHLFQLVQRPPAGSREQDILSGQLLHKMQKVRRQLTVPVQQGRVHVRRDQANAVHRAPPVIPCS